MALPFYEESTTKYRLIASQPLLRLSVEGDVMVRLFSFFNRQIDEASREECVCHLKIVVCIK